MQRCARCLLPESYPGLTLDEDAICNHCHTYQPKQKYGGQAELLYLGHMFQGSNPGGYDCLVALSGGRDSSFAAWYAVKQMGLNVLGYTFDNGFMPEETRRNVAKVTRILGMDHVYFTPGDMPRSERPLLKAWMAGPSPATIALLCTGCQAGYKIGLRRVAREHQIRFVISGSGEPQTSFAERLLAHDPYVPQHALSRRNLLRGFARELRHNPRFVLQPQCVSGLTREFSYRYALRNKPPYQEAPLFRYLDWNEDLIMRTITQRAGLAGWDAYQHELALGLPDPRHPPVPLPRAAGLLQERRYAGLLDPRGSDRPGRGATAAGKRECRFGGLSARGAGRAGAGLHGPPGGGGALSGPPPAAG